MGEGERERENAIEREPAEQRDRLRGEKKGGGAFDHLPAPSRKAIGVQPSPTWGGVSK